MDLLPGIILLAFILVILYCALDAAYRK